MSHRRESGFTLIELLIVIAIIGILAAIAIPNLLNAVQRGKQKRTMSDMRALATAIEAYAVDNNDVSAGGVRERSLDDGGHDAGDELVLEPLADLHRQGAAGSTAGASSCGTAPTFPTTAMRSLRAAATRRSSRRSAGRRRTSTTTSTIERHLRSVARGHAVLIPVLSRT